MVDGGGLENVWIGYTKTVIFSRPIFVEHAQIVARIYAIFPIFQSTLITDLRKFRCNSLT